MTEQADEEGPPEVPVLPLSEVEEETLVTLGYDGPLTKYQIMRQNRRQSSVVTNAMRRLQTKRLAKLVGYGKGQKGATTLLFDATTFGVITLLAAVNNLDFRRLAHNQEGRGVIYLTRWDFLESRNLTHAAEMVLREMGRRWLTALTIDPSRVKVEEIYPFDIMKAITQENEKIRFSLSQFFDEELADYYITTLRKGLEKYQKHVEWLRDQLERAERLRECIKKWSAAGLTDEDEILGRCSG